MVETKRALNLESKYASPCFSEWCQWNAETIFAGLNLSFVSFADVWPCLELPMWCQWSASGMIVVWIGVICRWLRASCWHRPERNFSGRLHNARIIIFCIICSPDNHALQQCCTVDIILQFVQFHLNLLEKFSRFELRMYFGSFLPEYRHQAFAQYNRTIQSCTMAIGDAKWWIII